MTKNDDKEISVNARTEIETEGGMSPLEPAYSIPTLPVRWKGPFFNPSGYASEAINFVLPLADRIKLGIKNQNNLFSEKFVSGLPEKERDTLLKLQSSCSKLTGGIAISHNPANGFSLTSNADYNIGRTMFETDRIPKNWVKVCNKMDEIWVPSQFNRDTF
ncbi:MAG TPA: hypothetical protein EYG38_01525, partial [Verrucomicrobia bacterium]|nr:hypothetical protein [Verrucomicrobiota bacterium]